LTFDWSIIDFLSCLKKSVALSHISELPTLLRKLSHTHALHELSNLFKISICKEVCTSWILNSQLYLCIFWNAIWLCYQLIIHACSVVIFREIYFSAWSVRTVLLLGPDACSLVVRTGNWHVWTLAVLLSADLAVSI
jgi:hypothetical protein